MLIAELCKSIGVEIRVRNLMVDYCDSHGNHFHKPLQTVIPPGCVEDDIELITFIKEKLSKQGFRVCGIAEALGDFEMGDLEAVFNGSDYGKYPMRALYVDVDKAKEEARSSQ